MKIAIVEDFKQDRDQLSAFINRYFLEDQPDKTYSVTCFENAVLFLEKMHCGFDIVFLDIQMPMLNGMDAAAQIRKNDAAVQIVFVTNMAQFAVRGYDVNAVGFVLKPVRYQDFYLSMRRAFSLACTKKEQQITIRNKDIIKRLPAKEVLYVEVRGHILHYHTLSGTVTGSGSLSELETQLAPSFFLRCNNCYLVNPRFIKALNGSQLTMNNDDVLQISRPRKKEFLQALNQCFSSGWA